MPQSIPKGLTREHVLRALADLDAEFEHSFGAPTGYELVHDGRRYPPKAVVGLAYRYLAGRVLGPEEFSGGEAPGQANFVLRELGFTIEKKGNSMASEEAEGASERGRAWSRDEVDLIVADYFHMLKAELAGESYSKSEHNRALQPLLDGRSKSSVEFKHQNISAVLVSMGLPYIDGYKPAKNYQKAVLPQAIDDYLIRHSEMLQSLAESPVLNPTMPPPIPDRPAVDLFEPRPDHIIVPSSEAKPWLSRKGRKIDFARRDAMNRHLGQLGEQFAVEVERRRLLYHERDDLAAKVEWVAETIGDGLGFDVLSSDEGDDSERFIEVKTTGMGKYHPFYVTANEVRCSEDCPSVFAYTGSSTSHGNHGCTWWVVRCHGSAGWSLSGIGLRYDTYQKAPATRSAPGRNSPAIPTNDFYSSSTARSSLSLESLLPGGGSVFGGSVSSGDLAELSLEAADVEPSPPRLSRKKAPPWFNDLSE